MLEVQCLRRTRPALDAGGNSLMMASVEPDEHSPAPEDDPADATPVHFKDFDLEAAVREELGKPEGATTRKDLASLRVFMAEKHEICDLRQSVKYQKCPKLITTISILFHAVCILYTLPKSEL